MIRATVFAAALAAVFALPAQAADIAVSDPFARATAATAKAGGMFMTIVNSGAADRLIGAKTPRAARAELHTHLHDANGVMKMREIEGGIPLPAGETVALKPGGLHVMLMGLNAPLLEGETVPLVLEFESGAEIAIEAPVVSMRTMTAPQ